MSHVGFMARFGVNDVMLPGEDDLYVEYFDSNIMVMVRGYGSPRFHNPVLPRFMLSIHAFGKPESRVPPSLLRRRW
jgi:hypothetical protein